MLCRRLTWTVELSFSFESSPLEEKYDNMLPICWTLKRLGDGIRVWAMYLAKPTETDIRNWKRNIWHDIIVGNFPEDSGHFPFNQNFRFFEVSTTSSIEWNCIFRNFRKAGQPRVVYPNFRKAFFTFNFAHGIFRTLGCYSSRTFWKFPYHWPPFPNFRKFWSNGKHPTIPIKTEGLSVTILCQSSC